MKNHEIGKLFPGHNFMTSRIIRYDQIGDTDHYYELSSGTSPTDPDKTVYGITIATPKGIVNELSKGPFPSENEAMEYITSLVRRPANLTGVRT